MQEREYSDEVVTSDEVIECIFWVYTTIYWYPVSTFNEWLNNPDFFSLTNERAKSIKEYLLSLSTNPLVFEAILTNSGSLILNDSHYPEIERIKNYLKSNPNLCRKAIITIKALNVLNVLRDDKSIETFENIIRKFDESLYEILKKVDLLSNPGWVNNFQKNILQKHKDIDSILIAEEGKLQKQQQLLANNEQAIKLTIPQNLIDNKDKTNVHWLARNKWLVALATILILMVIASTVTLVVLGLIASPWLAIPCLLLFAAALVGIGIFYNEHKLNISKSSKLPRSSSEVATEDSRLQLIPTPFLNSQASVLNEKVKQGPRKAFWSSSSPEILEVPVIEKVPVIENEERELAERAKKIIVEKISEFVQSQKAFLTISYADEFNHYKEMLGFSPEELKNCFSDIENKLIIVESGNHYALRWNVVHASIDKDQALLESKDSKETLTASKLAKLNSLQRELVLISSVVDKCLEGNFAVCDTSKIEKTSSGYLSSIIISSSGIKEILEKYPGQPQKTNANL